MQEKKEFIQCGEVKVGISKRLIMGLLLHLFKIYKRFFLPIKLRIDKFCLIREGRQFCEGGILFGILYILLQRKYSNSLLSFLLACLIEFVLIRLFYTTCRVGIEYERHLPVAHLEASIKKKIERRALENLYKIPFKFFLKPSLSDKLKENLKKG
mgnify:CR=1 FL=1